MNLKQIKKILEDIPDDKYTTGTYDDDYGKCCSIGHLRKIKEFNPSSNPNYSSDVESEFIFKVRSFLVKKGDINTMFISVNDGFSETYKQTTPKARVLTLLTDMIEEEELEVIDSVS